jgi:EpsI family protein
MYTGQQRFFEKPQAFSCTKRARAAMTPPLFVWILTALLLVLAGITYRVVASHLNRLVRAPVQLPVPLSKVPLQIGSWSGQEVQIPTNVIRVTGADDFLNRVYSNKITNQHVSVYIAYTARPRTMLGHRPQVCYPAGGWVHDSTEHTQVYSASGRKIPSLLHRFHMPAPSYEERVILNFYIVNSTLTSDESVFSGVGWRTPNIAGDPARYAAQVQIASILEAPARKAARDMADILLEFFPDENGNVKATLYYEPEEISAEQTSPQS